MDFGLHGIPEVSDAVDLMDRYRSVLDRLPPQFSTIWISDHPASPVPEAWTRLTYLMALFPRLRFGHLVLSQSYRNPALLAKMAASLQVLSGGRYILGLGAGWAETDYRTFGYDFPPPGVRVAQLAETIEIVRAMWSGQPATYHGEHYRIDEATCDPLPSTPIPILVGTNGPKALRVVARLADQWNWDGPWEPSMRPSYEILAAHCAEIGRPIDAITLTADCEISLPADPADFVAAYPNAYYETHPFGPTPDDAIRELRILEEHGVHHAQLGFDDVATLDRFIAEVVPAFPIPAG